MGVVRLGALYYIDRGLALIAVCAAGVAYYADHLEVLVGVFPGKLAQIRHLHYAGGAEGPPYVYHSDLCLGEELLAVHLIALQILAGELQHPAVLLEVELYVGVYYVSLHVLRRAVVPGEAAVYGGL